MYNKTKKGLYLTGLKEPLRYRVKEWTERAQSPEKGEQTRQRRIFNPAVDIIERKEDIVLLADMPGVDEKSVDITLDKNELTLYGSITPDVPDKHTLYLSEYGLGDYHRVFTLAEAVNRDKIQASVKNGVLKIDTVCFSVRIPGLVS